MYIEGVFVFFKNFDDFGDIFGVFRENYVLWCLSSIG